MKHVDARGQACPKPVMMTKAALDEGARELEIIVDNAVSESNVTRFLRNGGWQVSSTGTEPHIVLHAQKESAETAEVTPEVTKGKTKDEAILIATARLGGSDEALGEVLMKAFLGTLAQRPSPPALIVLMNEAVTLALEEHSTSESLKHLEEAGTRLLVCGTCTNHFGITDQVTVGTISNMFEITEALLDRAKTVTLG